MKPDEFILTPAIHASGQYGAVLMVRDRSKQLAYSSVFLTQAQLQDLAARIADSLSTLHGWEAS